MIQQVIEESEMTAGDGVFLLGAGGSPGRHIASALMRLGQRTLLHLPRSEDASRLKPLNTEIVRSEGLFPTADEIFAANRSFTTLILSPSKQLSLGSGFSPADAESFFTFLKEIETRLRKVHKIILISEYESSAVFDKARALCPSALWILCPVVVGFRDENLFDELFSALKRARSLLIRGSREPADLKIAFASDVAGTVISAIKKTEILGKTIRLPANLTGIQNLAESFRDCMREYEAGSVERLFRRPKQIGGKIKLVESERVNQSSQFSSYPLASDLFPNPPTRTERFLAQSKDQWVREPEMDLHFPPARTL